MSFWQRISHSISPENVFAHGVKALAIAICAIVVSALAGRALRRLEQRAQTGEAARAIETRRAVTAIGLAASAVRWAVFLIAAIMVLREVGIEATPILASAGIIGLAVGFGAQTLVRDVVSGFFMTIEGQLAVGDKAEINGLYGVVDDIGLRTTRMVSPGGQVRYFGNGAITSIVRYPSGAAPYVVGVPAPAERDDEVRQAVIAVLFDLDAEQRLLAAPPRVRDVLDLPTYGRVIRIAVDVLPSAKAVFEAKAPARIAALLAERGLPLAAGREITVQSDAAGAESPLVLG